MGFIMLSKRISGIANGASSDLETGSDVLTAFLTNLTFYSNAERTNIITPASGSVLLEYSSGNQVWHVFTGGRIDLSSERMIDPYANNSRILYIRATFTGIPSQPVYFSADFFLLGSNGPAVDPRVYNGFQGITTQPFTEANVKNGTQFEAATSGTIAASATIDTVFITGSKPVLIKASDVDIDGAGVTVTLYRTPTYTLDSGAPVTPYNLKDSAQLTNPSTVTIRAGVTVQQVGTQVSAPLRIVGGNNPGSQSTPTGRIRGLDRELQPNTTYLRRVVSNDASESQTIATYSTWYEGPLSVDL